MIYIEIKNLLKNNIILKQLMDFSKYNKGLRLYATLFDLNADIFNYEYFYDIELYSKDSVILLFEKLYDEYTKKLLVENKYFYTIISIKKNNNSYIGYIFKYKFDGDKITADCILSGSTLFITESFYIKVCIHWKKYLDNSFLELLGDNFS